MKKKILLAAPIVLVTALVAIQFVPVDRTNPPVRQEPAWDAPATRALAVRACFDCHSNETKWPWYSRLAPVSWMLADHVKMGREELNFSEWPHGDLDEAAEEIEKGTMPIPGYRSLHPEARLSDAEFQALADGLRATYELSLGME